MPGPTVPIDENRHVSVPMTIEEFIRWADSTPAVTWSGRDGVKDRYRQLLAITNHE